MRTTIALVLALLAIAAGCGSDEDEDDAAGATTALTDTGLTDTDELAEDVEDALEGALTLDLQEQNDSGITGEVEFSPTSEGDVEVEIELDGSDGGPHPAHIHKGSCANLDPEPAFPLEDVADGRSSTTVEVDIGELTAQEYAVNVHESAENASVYVACADIRNQ